MVEHVQLPSLGRGAESSFSSLPDIPAGCGETVLVEALVVELVASR